ncbi:ABC transporter permease [Marinicrinis sediminis]|uniref:Putative hemin transport system permease protein HrtB n=1 Tax=Marinicrinis sediminis TaxID=1652465 RepID=A0ABW5REC2_9BACL
MNACSLIWRQVMHRKALSILTVGSVAMTVALIVFLILTYQGMEEGAKKGYGPFELVIGADGSETQLVLNTFYHTGVPTGNIDISLYEQLQAQPEAKHVLAITTGDNLNGYPIVGIDAPYFPVRYGEQQLQEGRLYTRTGEVVIGYAVAEALKLEIGDRFVGGHGIVHASEDGHVLEDNHLQADGHEKQGEHHDKDSDEHHEGELESNAHGAEVHDEHDAFVYEIVGILPRLGTADDRVLFTTLDYAWAVHGLEESEREVTAILIEPSSLTDLQQLKLTYDALVGVQAVYASKAIADVVNLVDKGSQGLTFLLIPCVLLAAISILLSLLAAVHERKRDVGLLRLVGKSNRYVCLILIGEGLCLTVAGMVAGVAAGHAGSDIVSDWIFAYSGFQVQPWSFSAAELQLLTGTILIGLVSSLGPAWTAFRVDPLKLFRS